MQNRKLTQQEREWQAQSDLSALRAAEQIKSDRERLAAAKAQGKKEIAALARVTNNGRKKPRTK